MIRNLIFDLGGVVITLDQMQAARRFEALGLDDARQRLNAYTQEGIFGELESGKIDAETFRTEVSKLAGREITHEECAFAWQGYAKEVPERNLDALIRLRREGYRLILLSNTNPYMMEWVRSTAFDGHGHGVDYYFDALYLSYEMKMTNPSPDIFLSLLASEGIEAGECLFIDDGQRNVDTAKSLGMQTLCPDNGADWTGDLAAYLI